MSSRRRSSASTSDSNSNSDSGLFFAEPSAEELYPSIQVNARDLESFRRSTITRALVRDIHVEQHRIRDTGMHAVEASKRDELRGRLDGIAWVLSQLESYFRDNGDVDDAPSMTTDINAEL